jgi:hypothetical protein
MARSRASLVLAVEEPSGTTGPQSTYFGVNSSDDYAGHRPRGGSLAR